MELLHLLVSPVKTWIITCLSEGFPYTVWKSNCDSEITVFGFRQRVLKITKMHCFYDRMLIKREVADNFETWIFKRFVRSREPELPG